MKQRIEYPYEWLVYAVVRQLFHGGRIWRPYSEGSIYWYDCQYTPNEIFADIPSVDGQICTLSDLCDAGISITMTPPEASAKPDMVLPLIRDILTEAESDLSICASWRGEEPIPGLAAAVVSPHPCSFPDLGEKFEVVVECPETGKKLTFYVFLKGVTNELEDEFDAGTEAE